MGRPIKKDSTDQSTVIRIIDSTDGTPENAVDYDTSGIDLWYRREGAVKVSITEAALAALDSAHSDGGIELIGDGYYRLDLPDAAWATGADGVMIGGTVTGMIVIGNYHTLVDYDPYDAVRMGMTALPNAVADGAGGLPVSDAGGLDMDTKLANTNEVTAARMGALTDLIDGGRLDLIFDELTAQGDTNETKIDNTFDDVGDVLTNTNTIIADTNELQTDLHDGGRLDLLIDAIKAVTDVLPDGGALTALLASIATILADTSELQTDDVPGLIAALNDLDAAGIRSAVGLASANLDTQLAALPTDSDVNAQCDLALSDYDAPTKTEMDAGFAGLNDLSAADVNAECDTALSDYDPPTKAELDSGLAGLNDLAQSDILADSTPFNGANIAAIKAKTDNLPSGIPKNVALSNFAFFMVDSSDHVTPKTGLTITATISKDGGAFASCSNSATELSSGVYLIDITQTEMNADVITLKFTASGADQRTITIKTDS